MYHTVQCDRNYRSADCDTKLCQAFFPHSDIVKKLYCGRTKDEAILNCVLAPASFDDSMVILNWNMIDIDEVDIKLYS